MKRYAQLLGLIDAHKPKTIFEFGIWNGERAVELIKRAQKHRPDVEYAGVDLFEEGTPELDKLESNAKPRCKADEVQQKIKAETGLDCMIIRGNSRDLKTPVVADLVFIDGGHSVETIANDYELSKASKIIVFDDVYLPGKDGKVMDTNKWGANKIIEGKDHAVLGQADPVFFEGKPCGHVAMAVMPSAVVGAVATEFKIKTKNVETDANIQANLKIALARKHIPRIQQCAGHDGMALMCAGGPSLDRKIASVGHLQKKGGTIFAVKSAHDRLIEAGIVPQFCILLDPRAHVRDHVADPHPEVAYLVASMCHPSTLDTLLDKGATVFMYHAMVGAGEQDIVKEKGFFVVGGCSSATRGIALIHVMGFRRAMLFGYDLSYDGPGLTNANLPGMPAERISARVEGGKILKDGDIWTDYEKIAQAQEVAMVFDQNQVEITYAAGTVVQRLRQQKPARADYHDVFGQPRRQT